MNGRLLTPVWSVYSPIAIITPLPFAHSNSNQDLLLGSIQPSRAHDRHREPFARVRVASLLNQLLFVAELLPWLYCFVL